MSQLFRLLVAERSLAPVFLVFVFSLSLFSAEETRPIALTGDPTPGGTGQFGSPSGFSFLTPVINDAGQIAFSARSENTAGGLFDAFGIYLFDNSSLVPIMRTGLNSGNNYDFFGFPTDASNEDEHLCLNENGVIASYSTFLGTSQNPTTCGAGLFRFRVDGFDFLAPCGETPGLPWPINDFSYYGFNNAGQIVLTAISTETDPQLNGIFLADDSGIVPVITEGDAIPDSNSGDTYTSGVLFGFNNAGHALLIGSTQEHIPEANGQGAVFLVGKNFWETIAASGDAVPEGNGDFAAFLYGSLNQSDQLAFVATLQNTSGGLVDDTGLYLYDGALHNIVRERAPNPVGGEWSGVNPPAMNDLGKIAFQGFGTLGAGAADGIYVATLSSLEFLIANGTTVPGTEKGIYFDNRFPIIDINNAGQVLFQSRLTFAPSDADEGIFLVEPDGTLKVVVMEGQELAGGVVTEMKMSSAGRFFDAGFDNGGQSALNNKGQVVFMAKFEINGVEHNGIFLWGPPIPPQINSIGLDGNAIVIEIPSESGKSYQLKRRIDLSSGSWMNEGAPQSGTGGTLQFRVEGVTETAKEFYFVEVTTDSP